MIRNSIIFTLNKTPEEGLYDELKKSLIVNFSYEGVIRKVSIYEIEQFSTHFLDNWFKGVINSLYYRPNKFMLVLLGKQGVGKTEFFRRLLPNKEFYSEFNKTYNLYSSLIMNFDECVEKKFLEFPYNDNFIIYSDSRHFPRCDKRLASYCCTTNVWNYPQRKSCIVLNLESIDFELFNSIDKLKLWIEIFNKFKQKHRVSFDEFDDNIRQTS